MQEIRKPDIITALCEMYGGLDWKQRPEAAALPRDILHSVVMSAWKESGQW